MRIEDHKKLNRVKYKSLRDTSTNFERESVKKNVELFLKNKSREKILEGYIAIYWPIQNEVDLRSIKAKYSLALPRCTSNKKLEFYIWDESPLENDCEGIPAPKNDFLLEPKDISLIFAPCLSIDKRFIRLGYGGGYFDKLRGDILWNKIQCVGVLTANCVSNDFLVKTKLDIPLSGYITEKEILV